MSAKPSASLLAICWVRETNRLVRFTKSVLRPSMLAPKGIRSTPRVDHRKKNVLKCAENVHKNVATWIKWRLKKISNSNFVTIRLLPQKLKMNILIDDQRFAKPPTLVGGWEWIEVRGFNPKMDPKLGLKPNRMDSHQPPTLVGGYEHVDCQWLKSFFSF